MADASAPIGGGGDGLSSREQQLWERQAALFEREMARWEQERQAWARRETELLLELSDLRRELKDLLLSQQHAQPMPGPAPAAYAPLGPPAAPAAAPTNGAAPSAGASVVAAALSSVQATPPPQAGQPAWASLFGADGGGSNGSSAAPHAPGAGQRPPAADEVPSHAVSIAAALAAVETGDVLADLGLSPPSTPNTQDSAPAAAAAAATAAAAAAPAVPPPAAAAAPAAPPPPEAPVVAAAPEPYVVEVQKAPPDGPPPLLTVGDDDIYWVAKLHAALTSAGYYPSDEEVENFFFGSGTESALLTLQACEGLPETGIADEATWAHVLRSEAPPAVAVAPAPAALEPAPTPEASTSHAAEGAAPAARSSHAQWPVVMDMDGGKAVHALQVALGRFGYHASEDEMRWWQCGESTVSALKTFQACNGLPESGVTDERTWLALLGADATPDAIDSIRGDNEEYEDDMSDVTEGAVWLLGEQRWALPS